MASSAWSNTPRAWRRPIASPRSPSDDGIFFRGSATTGAYFSTHITASSRRSGLRRRGRILFIDAVHEVARERAQSFLKPEHQERILNSYQTFADEPGFAKVATIEEVLANEGNLAIPRYVRPVVEATGGNPDGDLRSVWAEFEASGKDFWQQMDEVVEMLDGMSAEEASGA